MKIFSLTSLILSSLLLTGCKETSPNPGAWISDPHGHIRFASSGEPLTLDPRYARDLITVNTINNLYEGLLTKEGNGSFSPAVAESYEVSEDRKTYTFHLRPAKWSNGDPITSHHFAEAWRSQLLPSTPMPNGNQLYPLKNALLIKEGKGSPDSLGVETPDDQTLIVHLETPLPYFESLIASYFFLPVHPDSTADLPITNGPFKLDTWKKNDEFIGVKNEAYWDAANVNLQKFSFVKLDDRTALQMFEGDQIDWTGSPLSNIPADAIPSLKKRQHLYEKEAAGTYWLRVNTTRSPLSNRKIRLALAYAIDREALIKSLNLNKHDVALAIVPTAMGLKDNAFFADHDVTKAWDLFQQGLQELEIPLEKFPTITLFYSNGIERYQKMAQMIQHQWTKVFGEHFELKSYEFKSLTQKLIHLDYDVALGSWFADVDDPHNFLDRFTYKNQSGNNTGWEDQTYIAAINQSLLETSKETRERSLQKAQSTLMSEMPVIPLYFATFQYVKKGTVSDVELSDQGYLKLKKAFINLGDAEELEGLD